MFTMGFFVGGFIIGCIGFFIGKMYGSGAMRKAIESGKVIVNTVTAEAKDIG